MKKIALTIIMIAVALSTTAQEFRGFMDAFAGRCLFKSNKEITYQERNVSGIRDDLTLGLYFTGGYQFTPQWFAGIGFGGYTESLGLGNNTISHKEFVSIYLPVFADVRWTLNLEQKTTPYVDLKVGYQFGINLSMVNVWSYGQISQIGYKNTMLLQPGIGVRFGKKTGFNLGLAYNTMIGKKIVVYDSSEPGVGKEIGSVNSGTLMLTFGVDF